jgi:Tol biopolymer transport system component
VADYVEASHLLRVGDTILPLTDIERAGAADSLDDWRLFWSPDGRWIGFFGEETLKKVAVAGGTVQTVAGNISDHRGASWGADDTILFGTGSGAIYRVAAAGGTPQPATRLDSKNEGSHRWPQFLPDGRHFLFNVRSSRADHRGVYVGALNEETRHQLLRLESDAHYVAPGYLLFMDGDTLLAQPFDSDRLVLSGQATPIGARVGRSSRGNGAFSTSRAGTIAYSGATLRTGRLTWFDRRGTALGTVGPDGEHDYADFRLSRDEKRLAASLVDPKLSLPDVWLFDLARGAASRLTFGPAVNAGAVWSPQGDRIAFRTNRKGGVIELYQMSAVEGGNDEPLVPEDMARRAGVAHSSLIPTDWSSDGQRMAFTTGVPSDIWLLTIADPTRPVKVVASPGDQMHGNFSPDGSAIAYTSNESGRFDVYVQSLRPPAHKWPISVNGGHEPRWRADGRELYYLADDQTLMAVPVSSGTAPFGVPRPLFRTQIHVGVSSLRTHYVPNGDGSRFLIHRRSQDVFPTTITVVLNGMTALKR